MYAESAAGGEPLLPSHALENDQESGDIRGSTAATLGKKPRLIMTAMAAFSFFVLGCVVGVLGPAVPALADQIGREQTRLGGAFTCRGIGYLMGSFCTPFMERRFRTHHLLSAGLFVSGAMTLLLAYNTSLSGLFVTTYFQGLGLGGVDVAGNAVLLELWGRAVDPYMQALHSAFGLGAMASPAAVGAFGFVAAFVTCAVLAFVPVTGLVVESLVVTRWRGAQVPPEHPPPLHLSTSATDRLVALDGLHDKGEPIPWLLRGMIVSFLFLYVGTEVMYGGWLSTWLLLEGLTESKERAAFAVSIFWGAITIGRVIAIPLATRVRASRFVFVQLALVMLGCLLLLLIGQSSLTSATVSSAIYGLGMSSIFPLLMTLPGDLGLHVDMDSTSMFVIGGCLGEALMPLLEGVLIEWRGTDAFPWTVLVTCLLMWLLIVLICSPRWV